MWQTPDAQGREIGQIDSDMRVWNSELAAEAQRRGYFALPVGFEGGTPVDPGAAMQATDGSLLEKVQAFAEAQAHAQNPVIRYLPPTGAAAQDKIVQLYYSVWLPFFARWRAFYAENKDGAWWSNPAAEAEGYQRQLAQIRANARHLGMKIVSPEPEMFSASFLDPHHDIGDTAADVADKLGKAGQYALYGLLGLGGILAVTSIISIARTGHDPVGRYVSYARGGR